MSLQKEPHDASPRSEPEFDSNDAGWDPYVASLLSSGKTSATAALDDEQDDATPVMTISRLAKGAPRRE